MKKSAVEWFGENIDNLIPFMNDNIAKKFSELIEQAKEMEKEQQGYSEEDMKIAFYYGYCCENKYGIEVTFNDWFIKFKNK
jgi:hypothetical protein